ncbi:ADP-ribosyl-[dinitrogen reductase] glycohydrolase [Polystyrenella longa]|uniref:ADP-ribosyl-[dinitrogen reductase] glycohydrolase n=1 Tax=Polystyrenella longa TaxID=2528007 RepID=A0A518CN88_9PLAN|nr:ADP-ribosylglycohydrolase family protein [Polystyrenella longa]QDU80695.1 ADP-ribosyl-[dinitrogen reductase] glycohydrolase [Polystyrenella longa]
MNHQQEIDRQGGCFLGLAIGDALGAAVEFKSPGTFPPVTGYRDGGPHGLGPGEWTDDTSMALALAESMIEVGWDLDDQAKRYVDWWKNGRYSVNDRCFDIGITVSQALRRYQQSGDASTSGSTDDMASGNGSIMRFAPVAVRYFSLLTTDTRHLMQLAEESSRPTHGSEQCLSACRYFCLILSGLIQGISREEVLSSDWVVLKEEAARKLFHPAVTAVIEGSYLHKQPPEIRGTGYVVQSIEAALWAFWTTDNFPDAVLAAINLGDDADTTGAVCGQLAGAYYGESGIPNEWKSRLAQFEMLDVPLQKLIELSH